MDVEALLRAESTGRRCPLQLRCLLCDRWIEVDDESLLAKRAREQGPAFAFVCRDCDRRTAEKYGIREERVNPILKDRRWFQRVFS